MWLAMDKKLHHARTFCSAASGVQTRLFGALGIVRSNQMPIYTWLMTSISSPKATDDPLIRSSSDNMCAVLNSTQLNQSLLQ